MGEAMDSLRDQVTLPMVVATGASTLPFVLTPRSQRSAAVRCGPFTGDANALRGPRRPDCPVPAVRHGSQQHSSRCMHFVGNFSRVVALGRSSNVSVRPCLRARLLPAVLTSHPGRRTQAVDWATRAFQLEEELRSLRFQQSLAGLTESESRKEATRMREMVGHEKLAKAKAERRVRWGETASFETHQQGGRGCLRPT